MPHGKLIHAFITPRRLLAVALGVAALADDAQADSGFALQGNLGVRMTTVVTGGLGTGGREQSSVYGTQLITEMAFGYKVSRVYIGLGLEFSNNTTNQTNCLNVAAGTCGTTTNPETSTTVSSSNLLLGPDFQIAILRSPDQRVELIGDAALHFGHQFQSVSVTVTPSPGGGGGGATGPTESNFLLSYRIGPGVRFWAHKHFAIQATTGFGGQAFFDIPIPNVPATGNNSDHGIYANFGAMGVF
jgi:hypothetical protein